MKILKFIIRLIGDKVGDTQIHKGTFAGEYEVYDFLGKKYYFRKE